jgi:hypothetical protein
MAREILSKRNFLDFESPDSAISRSPMTLMKSIVSLHQGPKVSRANKKKKKILSETFFPYFFHVHLNILDKVVSM